jgi:hypothetical protein
MELPKVLELLDGEAVFLWRMPLRCVQVVLQGRLDRPDKYLDTGHVHG